MHLVVAGVLQGREDDRPLSICSEIREQRTGCNLAIIDSTLAAWLGWRCVYA